MRASSPQARMRGFTLLEVMFVVAIATFTLWLATSLVGSASDVSVIDRAHAQLVSTHRRSLEFLTNALRGVDLASLDGFDAATGTAQNPHFQRPIGSLDGKRHLGPYEQLVWRPGPTPVSGIAHPGAVWLEGPTGRTLAADRVSQGGFVVRQQGRRLAVRLTTYQPMAGEETLRVASTTTVSVRN